MDILIALVERPSELVSKAELVAKVWPNTFVEESSLRVHISALRRALGDGRDGNRFIINIPGRGYRFVAPVTVSNISEPVVRQEFIANLGVRFHGENQMLEEILKSNSFASF